MSSRLFADVLLSCVLLLFFLPRPAPAKEGTFTLLFTNDTLGQVNPLAGDNSSQPVGGVARRMTLIEKIRKEVGARNVVLVDGGDLISGTAFSEMTRGAVDCAAYRLMGYDAVAVGEHDFDYGRKALLEYSSRRGFDTPWVAVNVIVSRNHQNFVRPYVIRYAGGISIGILGFSNPDTPDMARRGAVRGLSFLPPGASAKGIFSILRKNVDIFIALTRLGVDQDKEFAKSNPFLHVIIGGHSKTLLNSPIVNKNADGSLAGPLIAQAGSRGLYLGRLDLTVRGHRDPKTKKAKFEVVRYNYQLIPITSDLPEDPKMVALVEKYQQRLKHKPLEETLATVTGNPPAGRTDNWLGQMAADAMRKATGAEVALLNNDILKGDLAAGPLTRQELYTLFPFDDSVVLVDMPGSSLKRTLELSASKKGEDAFLQVSGLKIDKKGGLLQAQVDGKPLEDGRKYLVAVTDTLASGGDGYDFFRWFRSKRKTQWTVRSLLEDFLKSEKTLSASDFQDRWNLP